MKLKWTIFLLTVMIIAGLAACGTKNETAPTPSPSTAPSGGTTAGGGGTAAVDADALYKQNCIACHGGNLEGKTGPNLTKVGGKLSKDQIAAKIGAGGGGMPAFKTQLKDTEIQGLADWLAAKK
ncbi:cytochrome c [Paenibacillus doosanensis]|uniref:Cytochrome c-551 n=1 Tax=Paenibacillus konkukensis TaxID=2020716 RepID=A0ABY4RW48_9BACL|nr:MULTISPECIES: cytochrome c [Paenibacillus]MCS7458940.1 cytochrome c [Paenibacillus doosanensis]UQZ86532.1 Cytochrome c-551 precursor [Paenibacillus konkukensis]